MKESLFLLLLSFFTHFSRSQTDSYLTTRTSMHVAYFQEQDFEKCSQLFLNAIAEGLEVFPMDWIHYGAKALVQIEEYDRAYWCWQEAIKRGVSLEDLNTDTVIRLLPESYQTQLYKDYHDLRKIFRDKVNDDLLYEITEMHHLDQNARRNYRYDAEVPEPWATEGVDPQNSLRLRQIVDVYGWPGFSQLGHESNKAYIVLIHCAFDGHNDDEEWAFYLPILKKALIEREITPWMYAWFVDRIAVKNKECQSYGTATQQEAPVVPIASIDGLNQRRKAIGLPVFQEEKIEKFLSNYSCAGQ